MSATTTFWNVVSAVIAIPWAVGYDTVNPAKLKAIEAEIEEGIRRAIRIRQDAEEKNLSETDAERRLRQSREIARAVNDSKSEVNQALLSKGAHPSQADFFGSVGVEGVLGFFKKFGLFLAVGVGTVIVLNVFRLTSPRR